jgi:hypothetical protein
MGGVEDDEARRSRAARANEPEKPGRAGEASRVGYFPDRRDIAGFRAAVMQPFDTRDEARAGVRHGRERWAVGARQRRRLGRRIDGGAARERR